MSRAPRFFISPDQASGPSITITGEDVRHIATVLRMKPGDELLLCDGQGAEYAARITRIDRSMVSTEVLTRTSRSIPSPRVTLAQGLPKADKMDLIMQKATELGVAAVVPLVTERTVLKLKDEEKRVARWQKICREAAMQSSRPDIPRVGKVLSLIDFLRTLHSGPRTLLLLPWEEGTLPIRNVLRDRPGAGHITVLIGPEGGISLNEATAARDAGFHAVSLGQNILRTETAAIAVLSMIQYEFMGS
jgi:16S rRNA (uracil1498-N3)-methyltransferase